MYKWLFTYYFSYELSKNIPYPKLTTVLEKAGISADIQSKI